MCTEQCLNKGLTPGQPLGYCSQAEEQWPRPDDIPDFHSGPERQSELYDGEKNAQRRIKEKS